MKYQLNTKMTEDDYYRFNLFVNLKSYYGKKQLIRSLTMVGVIFLICSAIVLITGGFNQETLIRIVPLVIVIVLWLAFSPLLLRGMLKARIKNMRKTGRLNYSPIALMEFYDDYFVETTAQNKVENKYSAVDRISILRSEGIIYIHMGALIAHIIPFSTFESREQFDEFADFIQTKSNNVDFY
ncbi:MAG: YcxB family protein [Ruminococcaceae bacterium]|nr:YcxB family protein [Oscillospiraceae bacterium]